MTTNTNTRVAVTLASILLAAAAQGCGSERTRASEPIWLAHFDAASGQLPEGLAVRDRVAYVGMATLQEVVRSTEDTMETYATFPRLPAGQGFLTGLAFTGDGALYAGLASFSQEVQTGIYRVPPGGGAGVLFATHADMKFPNDLLWDEDGSLYVTDSMAGAIWRVSANGTADLWLQDAILTGDPTICAPDEVGFGIGVNGIEVGADGAFYVAVTDRAQLVRIPRRSGVAGAPQPLAEPHCELLEGADGLVRRGQSFIVVSNRTDQVVQVALDGTASVLAQGGDLDFPASITGVDDGVWFTNFGLLRAAEGTARPGLMKLELP